jgi:hypothetical protein
MTSWNCRREPTIEELLADDVMRIAMRSAGIDADRFRLQLTETARRLRAAAAPDPRG